MSKAPVAFPPGTFRASAKVVHEKKADSDDDEPTKYSHELFTEYTFHEDGTYIMHGYPPINEKGRVVVNEKVRFSVLARRLAALTTVQIDQEFHVQIKDRVQTSQKGEWKPADINAVIRFAGDLKSFVWDAKNYMSPEARSAAESKEEKKEDKKEEKHDDKKHDEKKKVEKKESRKGSDKKDKKP